jgi:hypothetical protein
MHRDLYGIPSTPLCNADSTSANAAVGAIVQMVEHVRGQRAQESDSFVLR